MKVPALLAAAALLAVLAAPAEARKRPHLSWVRCYGNGCVGKKTVVRGGHIKLGGRHLGPGIRVIFKAATKSHKRAVKSQVIGSRRLLARVPGKAKSGRVYVRTKRGLRSNA